MNIAVNPPLLPLKAIIYSTDFSASSQNAGSYAALLAHRFGAQLVTAHAFVLSNPAMEAEAEAGPTGKSQQRKDLEAQLAASATRFGEGLERVTTVLVEGDPREAIPHLAKDYAPSLVVVGTAGRGRVARGIVGSVAERIMRGNEGPTLAVGPDVPDCTTAGHGIRRVLYATGLSAAAARGAAYAAAVAKEFNASLEVLHVIHPEDVTDPPGFSELQRKFEAVLQELVPQQAEAFCNPHSVVEVGTAHERILNRLHESQADLLVLSLRKSSHLWLASRLSGAFHIIASSPCPVLTITG